MPRAEAKLKHDSFKFHPLITGTTLQFANSNVKRHRVFYSSLSLPHHCVSLQKYIVDVASSTAQEFILAGKHKEAIPAAFHALRFGSAVFGPRSAQLVPAYLLLAEASIGKYCLNSNAGKGKTSPGSGFWFPFSSSRST